MITLLRRAATCAGLAVSGLAALSQAQDTAVLRERPDLRRSLPVAGAPVIQQSPNGLYQLSITDAGIELRGPKGVVKITDAGIVIGEPNTSQVEIHSGGEMLVRVARGVRLDAGLNMDLRAGSSMDIRASAALDLRGAAAASLMAPRVNLGCPTGKPAARVGDQVNTGGTPATIAQGSQTVLVC